MLNDKILKLVIDKIECDYKDDISLLVLYGDHSKDVHDSLGIDFYYVPKTEKAMSLCIQFIIEGISFDLFPMRWERLLKIAAMDSPQAYLILDSKIVYSSCNEDLERFTNYKTQLSKVINGDFGDALINKASEYLNETFIYQYNITHVCKDLLDVRIEVSKILNQLANIIIFINKDYHKGGNGTYVSIIDDSFKYSILPESYESLIEKAVFSTDVETIKEAISYLISNTKSLLGKLKTCQPQKESYDTLFTGYYEELKAVINCYRFAADKKNYYKLYSLASYIHEEVAQFMTKVEDGIWYDDRNVYSDYSGHFEALLKVNLFPSIIEKQEDQILESITQLEDALLALLTKEGIQFNIFEDFATFEKSFR